MTHDSTNPRRPNDSPDAPARFELVPSGFAPLNHPWLVAAWPGMGGVAAIAATHLVASLDAKPMGLIPEQEFFPVNHVEVHAGIARSGRAPRSMFFGWRDPAGRRDLIIFVGEAQPPSNGQELCRRVLDVAQSHGVERVVTFAAMASGLHPSAAPRVFGAVTAPELLEAMRAEGVELLREGQIGGLNGALLAAASERNIPGVCLLGEMPFFAAGAPNPKASAAALAAFGRLAEVELDLTALEQQGKAMESHLAQLFEQLQRQQGLNPGASTDGEAMDLESGLEQESDELDDGGADGTAADGEPTEHADHGAAPNDDPPRNLARPDQTTERSPSRRPLDAATSQRIEALFAQAAENRDASVALKTELDRLGVFARYENRFLDLFKKAE